MAKTMNKLCAFFVVTLCLGAVVNAEPPVSSNRGGKPIVSQRLLNRVADIIARGGDGSRGQQENEGPSIVDQQLIDRIARIISQNDGQLSWAHKNNQEAEDFVPPTDTNEVQLVYGVPPVEAPAGAKELAGTLFELSPPVPVPRIAAFDFNDDDEDSGYSSHVRGSFDLAQPETALRIASFDIDGDKSRKYTPPQGRANGGYSTLHAH